MLVEIDSEGEETSREEDKKYEEVADAVASMGDGCIRSHGS